MNHKRFRAIQYLKSGMKRCDVAKKVNVSARTLSRWKFVYYVKGKSELLRRKSGRPIKLSYKQQSLLRRHLLSVSRHYIFNSTYVHRYIYRKYKIFYLENAIKRLIRTIGLVIYNSNTRGLYCVSRSRIRL